jgi:hypothetical protein
MTQIHPRGTPTPNKNRFLPTTYHLPNVGHMEIGWEAGDAQIAVRVVDGDGEARLAHTLRLSELRAR